MPTSDCEECGALDVPTVPVSFRGDESPVEMCADCAGWWRNHGVDVSVEAT